MAKINLEKIILLIFFVVILTLGPGALFDHKIKHDFPFGYGASDAFQHQVRAEAIKDQGNFKFEAKYISKGFDKVEGRYPPIIYHLAVIFSYSSGIEVYDSIYLIVVLSIIISSLIVYLIIRGFNKNVALLSLPLSLIAFSSPAATGFLWGNWPSILAQSFLVLVFWSIVNIDLKNSFILIAIALSAAALTHTSEFVFAIIFLLIYFTIKLLVGKIRRIDFKIMIFAAVSFFVISFYYMVIFWNTWAQGQPYHFSVQPVWEGNPGFYLGGFGLLLIPMVIGFLFSFPKAKNLQVPIIFALVMLLSGFFNYAGFYERSFQIRFLWPVYLSVFFGLGLYLVFKLIIKKWNLIYTFIMFLIMIFLFSGLVDFPILKQTNVQVIPTIPTINLASNQGIMNQFHWESLKWLSDNTQEDANIYFFYGDIYSQDALLRNSKRVHAQVDPNDFIKSLQERKIKREYVTELPGDSGGSMKVRNSFFEFEDISKTKPTGFFREPKDICNFDYYIFDRVSRQEVLAQYNLLIAQELVNKEFINLVFDNQVVFILKNDNPGADCIEERTF